MLAPPKWTRQELDADAAAAKAGFRRERLDEPLRLYTQIFGQFFGIFDELVNRLPELTSDNCDAALISDFMRKEPTKRAFRYLAAPPISEDDLKTLADASLAPTTLLANPAMAHRVRDVVLRGLDPHRFPWVGQDRDPTPEERQAAIVASTALVATRGVEMFRRTDAKDRQEGKVKDLLRSCGFNEIARRDIPTSAQAPAPGEFMGETPLAGAKADVVARLHDGRILAIECKVSNSAVNSYKRLVHDTGGKATIWYDQIGKANIVASAVLNGVFSAANCETVQNDKLVTLFWDHRLDDLKAFVEQAN